MPAPATVELRSISKRFGAVDALTEATLQVGVRQIHVLAGENGSGKTTLMNVLAGLYRPDSGSVVIDGHPIAFRSPREALRLGIGMVHQHFELVRPFTALENVLLGHEGGRLRPRQSSQRSAVETLMVAYGLTVDLDARIQDVSIGVQQKIEILKALYQGVELLILDEPTTHLTPTEVDGLFATLRELVHAGLTVVLITHKLAEIREIADQVTVLRRGRVVATVQRVDATPARLIELLMGERSSDEHSDRPSTIDTASTPVLQLEHASASGLSDCSVQVRTGEIIGVAAVAGNGQRELAEAIVGTRPLSSGTLMLRERDVTRASVRERLLLGLGFVPDDRIHEGILPHLSIAETFALGLHHSLFRNQLNFDETRVRRLSREMMNEYQVAAPSERVATARLSGGNIQKVLVARAIRIARSYQPTLLVAMNPTRGLDLRSMTLIHDQLAQLRAAGGGVLLASEDLDELMQLCDRIVVMHRGRIAGEFARADFDRYRLGGVMAGAN